MGSRGRMCAEVRLLDGCGHPCHCRCLSRVGHLRCKRRVAIAWRQVTGSVGPWKAHAHGSRRQRGARHLRRRSSSFGCGRRRRWSRLLRADGRRHRRRPLNLHAHSHLKGAGVNSLDWPRLPRHHCGRQPGRRRQQREGCGLTVGGEEQGQPGVPPVALRRQCCLHTLDALLDAHKPRTLHLAEPVVVHPLRGELVEDLCSMVLLCELRRLLDRAEVYKEEAPVCFPFGVDREEEEVKGTLVILGQDLDHSLASARDGHTPQHQSGLCGRCGQHARERARGHREWRRPIRRVHHGPVRWRQHVAAGGWRRRHWCRGGRCTAPPAVALLASAEKCLGKVNLPAPVIEEQRLPLGPLCELLDEFFVLQIVHVCVSALDPCIRHLADLCTTETREALLGLSAVELLHEPLSDGRQTKVDERIADVALAVEVNRQVHKVILPIISLVEAVNQHVAGVAVGDVSQHDRGVPSHNAAVHGRHGRHAPGHAAEVGHQGSIHGRHRARRHIGLQLLRERDGLYSGGWCLLNFCIEQTTAAPPCKLFRLFELSQGPTRSRYLCRIRFLRGALAEPQPDLLQRPGGRLGTLWPLLRRLGGGVNSATLQQVDPQHGCAVVTGACGRL
mmetsp:Transcript_10157/g.30467  ORF Transcript_10157/g.30467 Transcript_10157/m.30467 type:complete len:616 (+) Transcript_10157:376-2223(+)